MSSITDDVRITTVNGPLLLGLPQKMNGTIEAVTVNGIVGLNDGFPPVTTDRERRHMTGRLGTGNGPRIERRTTNGSVRLSLGEPQS